MTLTGLPGHVIREINAFLPYVHYSSSGQLHIEKLQASDLIERFRTPLLVFSATRIRDNVDEVRRAFSTHFPNTKTFFAVKSCYLKACLEVVASSRIGAEVMTEFELDLALSAGFHPEDIVVTGLGKTRGFVQKALEASVRLHVVDSLEDLSTIAQVAASLGVTARLSLRIALGSAPLQARDSKLGLSWEDGTFREVLDAALTTASVQPVGVLLHQGTHLRSPAEYGHAIERLVGALVQIEAQVGHRFDIVDLGGGLETRFILATLGLNAEDFAAQAGRYLSAVGHDFQVQVQPGRFIMADAAVGLTRVLGEKQNYAHRWRIVDMGSNVLIPLGDLAYYPIPTRISPGNDAWCEFHIGDGTGAPSAFCTHAALPSGPDGRELALLNCGAYTTVFAEVWAYPLPEVVLLDDDDIRVVYPRDRFSQLAALLHGG